MRTNKTKLVKFAVQGAVMYPRCFGFELSRDGEGAFVPSVGGITYNVKVGDSAYGWAGDHIEPGVTATSDPKNLRSDPNKAFNAFSCIGNAARVVSGGAKGAKGVVTGHHGGVEHVIIDFPDSALQKMAGDDKILIEAYGQGLKLLDYPSITVFALDPGLLTKMGIKESKKAGKITVPVAGEIPARLMGSGIGGLEPWMGDYDLQTSDEAELKLHRLDKLKLGDLVAIKDHYGAYGWTYRKGAITIGVVIHGDSCLAGHGPGIQTIMTAEDGSLQTRRDTEANIANFLKIGKARGKRAAVRK